MQVLSDEQRKSMECTGGVVGPMPNPVGRAWIAILDALVRVLTLGRGRVIVVNHRAPVKWDGVIR